jgi:hypothetical protein
MDRTRDRVVLVNHRMHYMDRCDGACVSSTCIVCIGGCRCVCPRVMPLCVSTQRLWTVRYGSRCARGPRRESARHIGGPTTARGTVTTRQTGRQTGRDTDKDGLLDTTAAFVWRGESRGETLEKRERNIGNEIRLAGPGPGPRPGGGRGAAACYVWTLPSLSV